MSDETTTEQLAEIDRDMADIERQVAELVEEAQQADYPQPEPEPQPVQEPQAAAIEELRSEVHYVQKLYGEAQNQVVEQQHRIQDLLALNDTQQAEAAAVNEKRLQQVGDLANELNHVQRSLGESRQRNKELEALVSSLRIINEATEKTVRAADKENTDLQHRLNVVSAEWAEQSETVRKLRIELDALQQAPQAETVTVSPTSTDHRFEEGWDAGTARAVETIAEWLEPIRYLIEAADNMAETEQASNLAADIIRALPAIMRTLTGLTPED